jgi:hypothetical protein
MLANSLLSSLDIYFPNASIEVVTNGESGGEYIVLRESGRGILLATGISHDDILGVMNRQGIFYAILNSGNYVGEEGMTIYQVNQSSMEGILESPTISIEEWFNVD